MPYLPLTANEEQEMLAAVGASSMAELWRQALGDEPAPELKGLPRGASEFEYHTGRHQRIGLRARQEGYA